ncbi:hypothetical protein GQ55_5G123500 [Panicum hallii var. hallii]|uniref:Uncharacterized protein n=1 Tax=Panicum hallii var. hallii TaxID=1504633 RepID=A0A2T7DFH5_9POAL|nr:hypothetical protein GQ55_5G123500 [Panicum hallii var. hallii]
MSAASAPRGPPPGRCPSPRATAKRDLGPPHTIDLLARDSELRYSMTIDVDRCP